MSNIYPKCRCCGEPPNKGLYDGFRLQGQFICSGCEQQIIGAEPDSGQYLRNIQAIRRILFDDTYGMQPAELATFQADHHR